MQGSSPTLKQNNAIEGLAAEAAGPFCIARVVHIDKTFGSILKTVSHNKLLRFGSKKGGNRRVLSFCL